MRVGNDIVEVKRFLGLLNNKKFMERVFTTAEQEHIFSAKDMQKKAERMAGKFAAKEAVAKALGSGISEGVTFNCIEILPNEYGTPTVALHDQTSELMSKLGLSKIEVSISNTENMASAVCIIY